MNPLQLLTLVVPTQNCPAVLTRTVSYLARIRFAGRILILDSSDAAARQMNLQALTRHGADLDIGLLHFDQSHLRKCAGGLERVTTPYSLVCPDDAFVFSNALSRLVAFLENASGYSAAAGISVSLSREPNGKCYAQPGRPVVNDSPVVRFRSTATTPFPVTHAVQRSDGLRRAFQVACQAVDARHDSAFAEIVLNQMPVLQGRIHFHPTASFMRVDHGRGESASPEVQPVERCATQFQQFRDCMAEQLEIAGATMDHACVMIDRYYGELWDGGVRAASRTPGIAAKCRRELVRHYRQLVNLVRADHLLQRRRLRATDLSGQREQWLLANEMLARTAEPDRESRAGDSETRRRAA